MHWSSEVDPVSLLQSLSDEFFFLIIGKLTCEQMKGTDQYDGCTEAQLTCVAGAA